MTLAFHVPGSDGWLARLDARWKIAAFAVVIVGVSCLGEVDRIVVAAGTAMTFAMLSGVPPRTLFARLGPVVGMLLVLFIWPLFRLRDGETAWVVFGAPLSPTAIAILFALIGKTVALVSLIVALLEATPLPELGQGATALGTPRVFVHLVLLTQRYIVVLGDEFNRLRRALRSRGFRNRLDRRSFTTIGNVAGTLFVRGHERAERVHHAMAARGFDGVYRSLAASRTTLADVAFFAVMLAAALGIVAWDRRLLS